jgi:hypothetical protein
MAHGPALGGRGAGTAGPSGLNRGNGMAGNGQALARSNRNGNNLQNTNPSGDQGNLTFNRNYGLLNGGGLGYGYGGFGSGGYGNGGYGYGNGNGNVYGNGYGGGYGYGGNGYGRGGQLVPVYIPGFGWVYVPMRVLRRAMF